MKLQFEHKVLHQQSKLVIAAPFEPNSNHSLDTFWTQVWTYYLFLDTFFWSEDLVLSVHNVSNFLDILWTPKFLIGHFLTQSVQNMSK